MAHQDPQEEDQWQTLLLWTAEAGSLLQLLRQDLDDCVVPPGLGGCLITNQCPIFVVDAYLLSS